MDQVFKDWLNTSHLLLGMGLAVHLARIIHESALRDREAGRATGQPQDLGSEAYLNSTSQDAGSEEARKDGHIRGRSSRFMNYPGQKEVDRD